MIRERELQIMGSTGFHSQLSLSRAIYKVLLKCILEEEKTLSYSPFSPSVFRLRRNRKTAPATRSKTINTPMITPMIVPVGTSETCFSLSERTGQERRGDD